MIEIPVAVVSMIHPGGVRHKLRYSGFTDEDCPGLVVAETIDGWSIIHRETERLILWDIPDRDAAFQALQWISDGFDWTLPIAALMSDPELIDRVRAVVTEVASVTGGTTRPPEPIRSAVIEEAAKFRSQFRNKAQSGEGKAT